MTLELSDAQVAIVREMVEEELGCAKAEERDMNEPQPMDEINELLDLAQKLGNESLTWDAVQPIDDEGEAA